MNSIRVAPMGAGVIGLLRTLATAQSPALKLVVVADVRQEAAEALAHQYRCEATTDWEVAVQRLATDLVILSTLFKKRAILPLGLRQHKMCHQRTGVRLRSLQTADAIYCPSREKQAVKV